MDCPNHLPVAQWTVIAKPHPLAMRSLVLRLPVGASLADAVHAAAVHPDDLPYCSVYLGQRLINPAGWRLVRPKAGVHVRVVVVPQGGGDFLRTAAFLALAVGVAFAAPYLLPAGTFGLAAGSAGLFGAQAALATGLTVVGGVLINALIPVAAQDMGSISSNPNSTYSISGARNRADPWGPIPVVLGRHRVFGRLGSATYTEVVGSDQYLRVLLCWGYGKLTLSSLKIGETSITDFDEVEIEHSLDGTGTDLTLFPGVVFEDAVAIDLEEGADRSVRTTETDTDEVAIDILFPQGLYSIGRRTGDKTTCGVMIAFDYRVTGSGDPWTVLAAAFEIRAEEDSPFRKGYRYAMPARGQYDIAVRCTADQSGGGREVQARQWSALRSIRNTDPITAPGVAKSAIRIKATDQLYDEVDEINATLELHCANWDGTDWDTIETTSNPASIFRWVLTGPANPHPVDEADVDDDALAAWHEHCAEMDWTCNLVIDTDTSVMDVLRTVAATGWATPDYIDGLWTVIVDKPQTEVRQWFSPRNILRGSFSGAITYPIVPDAFRLRFVNQNKRFEQDELIVYANGYDAATAVNFEALELPGVTRVRQAAVLGRRHLVQATLRREAISFRTDLAGLVVRRGDLIGWQHDVMLIGTGAARLKVARVSSGYIPELELDSEVTIQGADYVARVAHLDGTSSLLPLASYFGETRFLELDTPLAEADAPEIGSLVMVGPADEETSRWLVKSVVPAEDLRVEITAVPEAPGLYTYTFADDVDDPDITAPAGELVPAFAGIDSGGAALIRSTDGHFLPRIIVSFRHDSARPLQTVNSIEVQYRPTNAATWLAAGFTNDARKVAIGNVQQGKTYDIRARFRFATSGKGLWAGPISHTVVGVTDPPPDITWAQLEGDRLVWRYASPPVDHRGFRIRWSGLSTRTTWEEGVDLTDGTIRVLEFPLSRVPHSARLVLIKAIDAAGNLSLNAARVNIVEPEDVPWRYISRTNLATSSYPGQLARGIVVASVGANPPTLQAVSSNAFIGSAGGAFIASADGAMIADKRLRYTYTAKITVPPGVISDDRMQVRITDTDGERDYEVLYRRSDGLTTTVPFANGLNFSTGFGWAAGEEGYYAPMATYVPSPPSGVIVTFKVKGRSTLNKIEVAFRARPLSERVEDLLLPATGVQVPLTKTFRRYGAVTYSIQGDNNLIRSVVVTKKTNLQQGPFLRGYNQSGAAQSGVVDVVVDGD